MAKKTTKVTRIKESAAPPTNGGGDMNVSQLAELLLTTVPELMESYTRADIELALDDRGWLVSKANAHQEMDAQTRVSLVNKSRLYWLRDPLAKQAVRLWTDYALGTGIVYKSKDTAVQTKLDQFMKDRRNRRIMSSEGQRKSCKKLLVDGEVFFAIFTAKDDKKVIRWIDPLQITDVITDPEDSEHILAYRRLLPAANGAQGKSLYYADWTCNEEDRTMAEAQKFNNEAIGLEEDVVLYHLPFDSLHQRGNGLLSCAADWSREHRRFMEARVAITQALSKYAYKLAVKGGQGAVDKVKKSLQSSFANGMTTPEKNPQTAPASTWIQNDGLDLNAVPRMTGAGDSEKDGNQLKLMVSAGTGIMLHYFGDPSTGNLATATAMELPMLKMFESFQELWKDAFVDIFTIVMDENSNDGVDDVPADLDITVELPPILADDLGALGTAFTSFANLWPELADEDEILTMVLTAMRVQDIDKVLKNLRTLRKQAKAEADAKEQQMAKLMGGAAKKPGDPAAADGAPVPSALTSKEAGELAGALLKVAEALGV